MRRFSEREQVQFALLWAGILVLCYVLVLAPFLEAERSAARAHVETARAVQAQLEIYQRTALAHPDREEELRRRQEQLLQALPEHHDQGRFLRGIEYAAREAGVRIAAVTPRPAAESDGLYVQSFEVAFHGGYFQVLSFLHALEEGERAVQFGDFTLRAEGRELHCVLAVRIASLGSDGKE